MPVGHTAHVPPPLDHDPASQPVQLSAPSTLDVPATHSRHAAAAVAPTAVEYVPALQLAHELVIGATLHEPGLQERHVYAPASEYAPAGHGRQAPGDVAKYVPAGQFCAKQNGKNTVARNKSDRGSICTQVSGSGARSRFTIINSDNFDEPTTSV